MFVSNTAKHNLDEPVMLISTGRRFLGSAFLTQLFPLPFTSVYSQWVNGTEFTVSYQFGSMTYFPTHFRASCEFSLWVSSHNRLRRSVKIFFVHETMFYPSRMDFMDKQSLFLQAPKSVINILLPSLEHIR